MGSEGPSQRRVDFSGDDNCTSLAGIVLTFLVGGLAFLCLFVPVLLAGLLLVLLALLLLLVCFLAFSLACFLASSLACFLAFSLACFLALLGIGSDLVAIGLRGCGLRSGL